MIAEAFFSEPLLQELTSDVTPAKQSNWQASSFVPWLSFILFCGKPRDIAERQHPDPDLSETAG
jgi:hypothetical protein